MKEIKAFFLLVLVAAVALVGCNGNVDSSNPLIGSWTLTTQPGAFIGTQLCATHMIFQRTAFTTVIGGKTQTGDTTYNVATPTKVWVLGWGPRSYKIQTSNTIAAEDYPPCEYRRD